MPKKITISLITFWKSYEGAGESQAKNSIKVEVADKSDTSACIASIKEALTQLGIRPSNRGWRSTRKGSFSGYHPVPPVGHFTPVISIWGGTPEIKAGVLNILQADYR